MTSEMVACEQNEVARPRECRARGEGDNNHRNCSGLELLLPHRLKSWCGVGCGKVGCCVQGQPV